MHWIQEHYINNHEGVLYYVFRNAELDTLIGYLKFLSFI